MTTFAVKVTYGNHFHLLEQVIESAMSEGIAKIIVVESLLLKQILKSYGI